MFNSWSIQFTLFILPYQLHQNLTWEFFKGNICPIETQNIHRKQVIFTHRKIEIHVLGGSALAQYHWTTIATPPQCHAITFHHSSFFSSSSNWYLRIERFPFRLVILRLFWADVLLDLVDSSYPIRKELVKTKPLCFHGHSAPVEDAVQFGVPAL